MFQIEKTGRLAELLQVPRADRNEAWIVAFFDAVWHASLEVGEPALFQGPDSYTYLRMHLPKPGKGFESNSLSNLAAHAAQRGTGVAIFNAPDAKEPEYVFSMGRLDSLLLYDSAQGDPLDLKEMAESKAKPQRDEYGHDTYVTPTETQVLVAAPSAAYLPPNEAGMLYRHLTEGWHMQDPRVALMVVPGLVPSRNLVISKKMSEFPDKTTASRQTQFLLWYLPPNRSLVLMPDSWTPSQMTPLRDLFNRVDAPQS